MKKSLLWLLVLIISISIIVTFSFAGCKKEAAPTEEEVAEEAPTEEAAPAEEEALEEEQIILRVLDPTWDPMQVLWQEKIIPEFEAANPGVKVEYEWVEWGPVLREKAVVAHASGAPYDVFMIPDSYLPGLVKLNVAAPIIPEAFGAETEDGVSDRYLEGVMGMCKVEGKIYAINVEESGNVFIYNPKHYEEIGRDPGDAPETFEEMLEIAKDLTVRDESGAMIRSGFYPIIYPGSLGGFIQIAPMIKQLGGSYFDETWTEPNFNIPEAVTVYELYKDMYDPDKIGCAELGFAIDENQMGADFVAGRISQIYGAAYMISIFEGIDPEFEDYVYAPVPPLKDAKEKVTAVWGALYCVDLASENQEKAWELLNFVSSEDFAYDWMMECGMFTGLKGDWIEDVLEEMPDYGVMFDELKYGSSALKTDFNDELETALSDHLERVISLGMDIEESLDILQDEAEEIMSQS